jgi:hypothetical protein
LREKDGGIAEAWGVIFRVDLFDEGSGNPLADIREDGFAVGLLAAHEAESHPDRGTLVFAEIQDEHAAFLVKADDLRPLEVAGADIGARFLAETADRVKLSHRCFHTNPGIGI